MQKHVALGGRPQPAPLTRACVLPPLHLKGGAMSWVNDLASAFGVPAGAATLAVAIYAACTAAEKSARPEALKDISAVLKDRSWATAVRPAAIIEQVFNWTFGKRQLGAKCIIRSLLMSLSFTGVGALIVFAETGLQPSMGLDSLFDPGLFWFILLLFLLAAALPDYIALAKTRILLGYAAKLRNISIYIIALDIILSLMISYVFVELSNVPEDILKSGDLETTNIIVAVWNSIQRVGFTYIWDVFEAGEPTWLLTWWDGHYPIAILFFLSTLSTSLWTILILLATSVVKLMPRLQRSTTWFFDVDKHPIQAIGAVSGALILAGAATWSLVRSIW